MKRGQVPQNTQHESIYRRDVKLPLHIGNIYQTNLKIFWNHFKTNFEISWSQQNELWYQRNQIVVDKIKQMLVPLINKQKF